MKETTVTSLHRRLLENLSAGTTDCCNTEMLLPAEVFFNPTILDVEKSVLFQQVPQPIAFSCEIARPGSYLALEVLDVPLLLSRDKKGELHAFLNACAHRGMPLSQGAGNVERFVCPFHGWVYNVDGSLRGRPQEDAFTQSKADSGLRQLAVAEHHGIVVAAISESVSQATVDNALEPMCDELANYQFENYQPMARRRFDVTANWKLVNDLSLESYHFNTLHRDSVAQLLASNAVVDTFGKHSRWAFPLKTIRELEGKPEEDWPTQLQGSCTYTLYPGVMFIVNALGAQMIRAEPGASAQESRVTYAGISAPDCEPDAARAAYEFGGEVFAKEDLPAAEQSQRGIAAALRPLPLGRNEPLLQFWHQQWRDALEK